MDLAFGDAGLLPVVVQDELTGEVRMVAFANAEAIRATLASGRATFWSRSRQELWEKGKKTGNVIYVKRVLVDCDQDCVIYSSHPTGPSCHTGAESCFFRTIGADLRVTETTTPQTLLNTLEAILESRKASTGRASYTKSLYDAGAPAIGAKITEEAVELARALGGETNERVVAESADVLYHLLVGLRWRGIALREVLAALGSRMSKSGHAEKAGRGGDPR